MRPGAADRARRPPAWCLLAIVTLLLSGCSLELGPIVPSPSVASGPTPFDTGNPNVNQPGANFVSICNNLGQNSADCRRAELVALTDAHAAEGLAAPLWPASFWSLPYDQQLFILANEERVDRQLPPLLGITAQADADARPGALHDRDPKGRNQGHPPILDWASNWASDYSTLAAEFDWMYDDGVSGGRNQGNLECPKASAPGCWGHRQDTLFEFPSTPTHSALVFGGACVADSQYQANLSCSEIFELDSHPPSSYTFSWSQAVAMGA